MPVICKTFFFLPATMHPPCRRPFVTCQLYWVNITALQERGSRHFKHTFTVSAPCVQERYLYPPNAVTERSPLGQHSVSEACSFSPVMACLLPGLALFLGFPYRRLMAHCDSLQFLSVLVSVPDVQTGL